MLENKTILLTGGTGSFGKAFLPMTLKKFNPKKMFGVSISFQNRGSHQGGPSHNYKDTIAVFSKDENTIDKLLQFLQKYITKGKVKRTKRKTKRGGCRRGGGGKKTLLTKLQIKNGRRLKECEKLSKNKYQKKKCTDEFNKTWHDYSKFLEKNAVRGGPNYADKKQYTPKQQRIAMKQFFGKEQKGGSAKKRTIKKLKKKENSDTAYFEFRSGSRKFWRIVRNGSKLTTHYGKIGTLGQMTTKDYGSKVDKKFDSLIKSKKGKGYVEKEYYGHVSESNPKPPTKIEREYLRICKKAEQNKKINPMMRNFGCEDLLDQGESELKC